MMYKTPRRGQQALEKPAKVAHFFLCRGRRKAFRNPPVQGRRETQSPSQTFSLARTAPPTPRLVPMPPRNRGPQRGRDRSRASSGILPYTVAKPRSQPSCHASPYMYGRPGQLGSSLSYTLLLFTTQARPARRHCGSVALRQSPSEIRGRTR